MPRKKKAEPAPAPEHVEERKPPATPKSESMSAEVDRLAKLIISGDLQYLTEEERSELYAATCRSLGLNLLTRPFEYIWLERKVNGQKVPFLTLYATRSCTDQLRRLRGVTVCEMVEVVRGGIYSVKVRMRDREGFEDISTGVTSICWSDGNVMKGDHLANAMMKAETKAKRRCTLSLCGLGWLDESEIASIPSASAVPPGRPLQLPPSTESADPVAAPGAVVTEITEPAVVPSGGDAVGHADDGWYGPVRIDTVSSTPHGDASERRVLLTFRFSDGRDVRLYGKIDESENGDLVKGLLNAMRSKSLLKYELDYSRGRGVLSNVIFL